MSNMTDPHNALLSFQVALANRQIKPRGCVFEPHLVVLQDDAHGSHRLTYAYVESGNVLGIAIFIITEAYNQLPCFALGYAVAQHCRGQGLATRIIEMSLREMKHGFKKTNLNIFYIEAVISTLNIASQKVASKIFTEKYTEITDSVSGEPAFQYFRTIHC